MRDSAGKVLTRLFLRLHFVYQLVEVRLVHLANKVQRRAVVTTQKGGGHGGRPMFPGAVALLELLNPPPLSYYDVDGFSLRHRLSLRSV